MADTGSTRQNLILVVLENLGVLAAGQPASLEDRACVDRRIDPTLATLAKREVFVGLSADALDPGLFLPVADVLAYACRTPFGITGAKAEELKDKADAAEGELKAVARQYSATAASDGFDAVRHVLEQLGVVAPGQDPSLQDRGVVLARAAPLLAELRQREIITVADLGSADPAQQRLLAAMLAASCAPAFGVTGEALAALVALSGAAEQALRGMARQFDTGVATSGTFDLIQTVLENLGAVAVGRTATYKDRSIIAGRVAAVLADLRNREVIDIPSLAKADPGTLLPLSVVLTSACALAWGLNAEVRAALQADAGRAEAQLRLQTRQLDRGVATSGAFDPAQAVLEMLGVVAPGQTASDRDRAVVEARIRPLLLELRGRDICGAVDLSQVTLALQLPFARLLAAALVTAFPVPAARVALLMAAVPEAERSLRYQSYVYEPAPPLRVEPFWGGAGRRADRAGAFLPPPPPPPPAPEPVDLIVSVRGGPEG